jgi:ADP-L-glycero-D-manno-heptose 6-epimerase
MIVLTGAGGFIGSVVLGYLNKQGIEDIIIFDDLPHPEQYKNLNNKKFKSLHSTAEMISNATDLECVIHLGAISNTLEKNWNELYKYNILSTRRWHDLCKVAGKKFIWASSASILGNGFGPMNQYAFSKSILEKELTDGITLRLYNVYGPNEYHKGRMASTIYHWYNQLKNTNKLEIFENSDRYCRDFIYVEDVAKIIEFFIKNYRPGTYDIGTGKETSFDQIADILINSLQLGEKQIIPMPEDLKSQYQNNTRANLVNLKAVNYPVEHLKTVEQGIQEYCNFLNSSSYY